MIKEIIENFKPADWDTEVYSCHLENDIRWKHLEQLLDMLEESEYSEDYIALQEFMYAYGMNERLMQKLCEKTDSHPIHFQGWEE